METEVILLGHGSKSEESNRTFADLCRLAEKELEYKSVTGAFLQLAEPLLDEAVARAVERGVERIVVIPLFLLPGSHVQKDIPQKLDRLKEKYPDVEFECGEPIGADKRLIGIIDDRIKEVV